MDIEYYKEPFPYAIEDNFLPQELYDRIKTNIQKHRIGRSRLSEEKEIRKHLGNKLESIRNTLLRRTTGVFSPHLTPNDLVIRANRTAPYDVYPIHRDSKGKRLSTVIYIGKFNKGTILHRSALRFRDPKFVENAEVVSSVEWKENRAMTFIPSNFSYHSIRNIQPYPRDTITINMYSVENSKKWNKE